MMRPSALRARNLAAAAGLVVWGLGILLTAAWFVARSSARPPEGVVPIPGLGASVLVVTDSFGLPPILADAEPAS